MAINKMDLIRGGKKLLEQRRAAMPPPPPPEQEEAAQHVPSATEVLRKLKEELATMPLNEEELPEEAPRSKRLRSLLDFPPVIPEKDNHNILIKGRWMERGGSAFLVSTAGTGKSIWSIQFALSMMVARSFSGLDAWRPFRCWVIQSEDSDDRVSIDRDDIIAGLENQCDIEAANGGERIEYDWQAAARDVVFADFTGLTGAEFLQALDDELSITPPDQMPDVIIINPLLDFLGGDMCSQEVASAFLSGGRLNGAHTQGLRAIIKRYGAGALIVHHTGKPPNESELKSWIKSAMPEYQAAGSSYITNWGRSFITMMKVPNISGAVMLTAGKNGGGLKWDIIGGARRRFLVWSDAPSVAGDGSRRHFWAEPTEAERLAILQALGLEDTEANKAQADALTLAEYLHTHPMTASDLHHCQNCENIGLSARRMRAAYRIIRDDPGKYGLVVEKDFEKGPEWFRQIKIEQPSTPVQIEAEFL